MSKLNIDYTNDTFENAVKKIQELAEREDFNQEDARECILHLSKLLSCYWSIPRVF